MWKRILLTVIFAWLIPISVANAQDVRFGFSFGLLEQIETSNYISTLFPLGQLQLEMDVSDHFSVRFSALPLILLNTLGVDGLYYFYRNTNSFYLGFGGLGIVNLVAGDGVALAIKALSGYRWIFSETSQLFLEASAGYLIPPRGSVGVIVLFLYLGFMFPI
jgi:hypothetical protein